MMTTQPFKDDEYYALLQDIDDAEVADYYDSLFKARPEGVREMSKRERIEADTRSHTTEDFVRVESFRVAEGYQEEISDDSALTIASWWSSPGTVGHVLAELASTGSANVTELLDDIAATRRTDNPDATQSRYLDLLATWAINHPSRNHQEG